MKLNTLVNEFGLEVKSAPSALGREIACAYVSDLLSDVIAHAGVGDVWITLQLHVNIVAVASMKELSGIIIINGRQPEQETMARAETEAIPIMVSTLPAFELAGKLYQAGIRGRS